MNRNNFCYDGLCISSGGYKGYGILGTVTILHHHGYLDFSKNGKTKKFSGCSVGSVLTLLLAVGWMPIELFRRSAKIKIFNGMKDIDVEGFKDNFGIMSNEGLKDEIETLILEKRKKLPTMLELYEEGIYLSFAVCDRRGKKGYKIDYKSCPLLLATEGAMMSSNIPFVFPPIDFKDMKIIDGALTNPFPLDYIDNSEDKILGIVVYGETGNDESLISYATGTLMVSIEEMQRLSTKHASDSVHVLEMFVGDLNVLNSKDAFTEKLDMYWKGFHDGKILIKALNKTKRKRSKPKARTRTSIKTFPVDLLAKCLISQPLDILCQAALTNGLKIRAVIKSLSAVKRTRIKELAKQILKDEFDPRDFMSNAPQREANFQENYSQQIYDSLPLKLKAFTKVFMDSLGPEGASNTIQGFNTIFEGLNQLGLNILDSPLTSSPKVEIYDEDSNIHVIEEIEEDEETDINNVD